MKGRKAAFVDEFITVSDATQAAMRAGYSSASAATIGKRLLKDKEIITAIAELKNRLHKERTATAEEVAEFFTAVMRGEIAEDIIILTAPGHQGKIKLPAKVRG